MGENLKSNPTLIKIRDIIKGGKPKEGRTLLAKFLKANAVEPWDAITISEIYRTLSELDRALQILGPELAPAELQNVSDDQLALQFRLAYMLQNNGARFLAERIFTNLTSEAKRRNKAPLSITPFYWRYLTDLYLTMEDFKSALIAAQNASETLVDDKMEWWGSKINEVIALFGLHDYPACELLLNQLLQEAQANGHESSDQVHLRFALHYMDLQQWEKAFYHACEAEKNLKNPSSLRYIYLYRTLGIYYSLRSDVTTAVKYLNQCCQAEMWPLMPPYTKMLTYYWLEYNLGTEVSIQRRLATRAHITFCPVSYVLGKCYSHEKLPLTLHFNMKYCPNKNDCWVINGETIVPGNYSEVIHKFLSEKWTLFDLYSGVVLPEQSVSQYPVLLTDLQVKCVSSILGAGEIGVSKWALIDFIYRQDFYRPEDGENRLKGLVKNLRKSGFDIKCQANIYSMDLPKNRIIILPMNHIGRGPQSILAIKHPVFKRSDVENLFQIGSSSAKAWIRQWQEEKIIESKGSGRNIVYNFARHKTS
ncbi:MAG: hypothetical protein HYV97_05445 [Bdellovibrio sp.]|nr:hypothetical protein [Bdellovibrio sp.]